MLNIKKNAGRAVLCILAAQPLVIKDSINTSAAGLTTLLGIGATIWEWGGKALKMIDTFAAKGMGYQYSFWFLSGLKDKAMDFYDWLKHNINETTFRKPEEFKKRFKEGCKKVKGQEEAKKEIMNFGLEVIHSKNEAEMKKEKRKGADIILFTGTSGCGKSMMAEVLADSISTAPAFVISSGDIDLNSKVPIIEQLFGERHSSVSYGGYGGYGGRVGYEAPNEKNCLIAYIERVKDGVVIINEYDKMHSRPPKDKQDENYLDPLDELLRAFADEGSAFVCGKKVDASNITFILTSNEKLKIGTAKKKIGSENVPIIEIKDLLNSGEKNKDNLKSANSTPFNDLKNETVNKESVNSEKTGPSENKGNSSLENLGSKDKERVNKIEEVKADEKAEIKNEKETNKDVDLSMKKDDKVVTIEEGKTDDLSSSDAKRDRAFLNRFAAKIGLEPLKPEDKIVDLSRTTVWRDQSFFNRIAKVEFKPLKQADLEGIVKDQYGENMISYWKKYANIDLDLSKIYEPVARKASTMPEHGRAVRVIMRNLTGLLSNTFEEYLEKGKDGGLEPKRVVVNYDEITGDFSAEIPEDGDIAKTK